MTNSTTHAESEVGGIAVATVVFLVGMVLLGSMIYSWSKPVDHPETKSFASRVLDRQVGHGATAHSNGADATHSNGADATHSNGAAMGEAGQSNAEPVVEAAEEESWD